MTSFPYPSNNITGIVDFINYVNNQMTQGFLGAAWLVIIFAVAYFSTARYTSSKALGFASFLTMISAIFLRFLQLINDTVLFITIVAFIAIFILLIKEDSQVA